MLEHFGKYRTLLVSQEGKLLRLTLNRPKKLNAIDGRMHAELEDFFYSARRDPSIGAILLSGAGRAFSSGGDLKGMATTALREHDASPAQRFDTLLDGPRALVTNMLALEHPVVCALHGYAMGLGATIALCSDIVIAAEDAIIADTHVTIGLVAGDGGAVIWPALLPISAAKYYLMTGDRITGTEAARIGLVLRALPSDEVVPAAEEIALRLANGPSLAIRWTKMAVNKILRDRANLLLDVSLALEGATMLSEDHRSAIQAMRADGSSH